MTAGINANEVTTGFPTSGGAPPPINYSTKPKVKSSLSLVDNNIPPSVERMVLPVLSNVDEIKPRLPDILAGHSLTDQEPGGNVSPDPFEDGYTTPKPVHRPVSRKAHATDLSQMFSRLSTSASTSSAYSAPSTATAPGIFRSSFIDLDLSVAPPRISTPQSSPRKPLHKFHVVVVGRLTGVFWDEWSNIQLLVKGVSSAQYKAFKTKADAMAFYEDAKANKLVRTVRTPDEEEFYAKYD